MDWKVESEKIWTRIQQLKAEGLTDDEILERMKEANLKSFEKTTKFMLDGGLSKPDVKNFWKSLVVSHNDPDDAYDSGDY